MHERFKSFELDRTLTVDDSKSGQPLTSINDENFNAVHSVIHCVNAIHSDNAVQYHFIVQEIGEEVIINSGLHHEIITEKFGMQIENSIFAKLVPHLLTNDQKENHINIS